MSAGGFYARVYARVRKIPRGRVATYGQVAGWIGVPCGARAVGWALRALDPRRERDVPWHRVVGAGGRISPRASEGAEEQRRRLRDEGVRFRAGCVDMARYAVVPPRRGGAQPGSRPRARSAAARS